MKTIAIVATADTKAAEMHFVDEVIRANGLNSLLIDTSTRSQDQFPVDFQARETALRGGFSEAYFFQTKTKADSIEMMRKSLPVLISELYEAGRIHGIIGFGGLQNAVIATTAMQALPFGFPKLIVSTVASGNRPFSLLTGPKDVVMMPSIADLSGMNPLSETILRNAAAAIVGMVKMAGEVFDPKGLLIGATLMGATSDGIEQAIQAVRQEGYQVVNFHSTGVGGASLESLILDGKIQAVMDLCLHEIVSQDLFGGGFSAGATNRLEAAVKTGIPMVLSPAGLDFIDYSYIEAQTNERINLPERKYTLHNKDVAHIKLKPDEAKKVAQIVSDRLAPYKGSAAMIMPLRGLRSETHEGEKLHDPEVDNAIFDVFRTSLNKNIKLIELDCHLSSPEFYERTAREMIDLIKRGGHVF